MLEDVELTYKGDPAPKEPNRIYDSSDKLNVVIKGWFVHMTVVTMRDKSVDTLQ